MIDEPRAREVAKGAFEAEEVVLGGAREAGWFSFKVFEYRGKE